MKSALNISFEFFPAKTIEQHESIRSTAQALAEVEPHFFSVTFGAGGSTRIGTIDTVKLLQQTTNVNIAPHLSCIGSSRASIVDILQSYQALGVNRIVALRGDIPSGMGLNSELNHASDLVSLIRQTTAHHFHIEVAAYPEMHPQAENALKDILHFKRKVEAGANSAITQYFFNPDAYFHFLDHCTHHGIFIPIIPGIMPITQFSKLVRFSDLCGAEIPRWIRKRLEAYADDQNAIQAFGLEVVYLLCQRLITGGAPGLHFYTLNQAQASLAILKALNITTDRISTSHPNTAAE